VFDRQRQRTTDSSTPRNDGGGGYAVGSEGRPRSAGRGRPGCLPWSGSPIIAVTTPVPNSDRGGLARRRMPCAPTDHRPSQHEHPASQSPRPRIGRGVARSAGVRANRASYGHCLRCPRSLAVHGDAPLRRSARQACRERPLISPVSASSLALSSKVTHAR